MRLKPILYSNNSNKIFEHSFDLIFRDQNIHDYKPTIDVKCRVLSFRLVIEHAKMGFNYQYQIFFLSPSQLRLFTPLECLGGRFIALRYDINSKVLGSNLHMHYR